MSSKSSKSERKEDRIQQLERELSETKKKLKNQSKVVRLDEEQISDFLEQLTERIERSTNRIVDETTPPTVIVPQKKNDAFSQFVKILMCGLFAGFGALGFYTVFANWSTMYIGGFANTVAIGIVFLICFACIIIGIDIWREKDRNYLIALFSALVSLVALIVAFVK